MHKVVDVLLTVLLLSGLGFAQARCGSAEGSPSLITTGTIASATDSVQTPINTCPGVFISVTGTFAGVVLNFQASDDPAQLIWYPIACVNNAVPLTPITTDTDSANASYSCALAGAGSFRIMSGGITSGTANIKITQTNNVLARSRGGGTGGGGGGGSGTVGPGTTGQFALYNGATSIAGTPALTSDNTNVTASGNLTAANLTSSGNVLATYFQGSGTGCGSIPYRVGSAPSANGFGTAGALPIVCSSTLEVMRWSNNAAVMPANDFLGWPSTSPDASVSRAAASTVRVGIGSVGTLPATLAIAGVGGDATITAPTSAGGPVTFSNPISAPGLASGTVSANNSLANALAIYPTAGGSTTVAPSSATFDGTSLNWSPGVGISLTSGVATNPFVFGRAIQLPVLPCTNTAPFSSLNFGAGGGIGSSFNGFVSLCAGGIEQLRAQNPNVLLPANENLGFTTNNTIPTGGGAVDAGFQRAGTGTIAVTNSGSTANEGGYIRSANTCYNLSTTSLPSALGTAFCTFTLPAIARSWRFNCFMPFHITAAPSAATLDVGINLTPTPSAITQIGGLVFVSGFGGAVAGDVPLTLSGVTTIVSDTSLVTGDTGWATLDGAVAWPAVSGQISITADLSAPAGATGTAGPGVTCRLE